MEMTVTDNRRVKDETLGPAAIISTSTLKPKEVLKKAKAPKKPKKPKGEMVVHAETVGPPIEEPFMPEEAAAEPPSRPKRKRKKAKPEPVPEPEPLELADDTWCGLCGAALYVTPSGLLCEPGGKDGCGGAPPETDWAGAAEKCLELGMTAEETAAHMQTALEDVEEHLAALADPFEASVAAVAAVEPEELPRGRCVHVEPDDEPEDAPFELDPEVRANIIDSFSRGASVNTIATLLKRLAPGTPLELLEELHAEHAPPPEPDALEQLLSEPANEPDVSDRCVGCGGMPDDAYDGPLPVAADYLCTQCELEAEEARDAEQLQPVFKTGDLVTVIEADLNILPGQAWVVADPPMARGKVHLTRAPNGPGSARRYTLQPVENVRHFTEELEEINAEWAALPKARDIRLPNGETIPGWRFEEERENLLEGVPLADWTASQVPAELTSADYERIGRLWVGALAAGMTIQEFAARQRTAAATIRADILEGLAAKGSEE